jgi:N-carbamoyl-L-amino-acid hydrolase
VIAVTRIAVSIRKNRNRSFVSVLQILANGLQKAISFHAMKLLSFILVCLITLPGTAQAPKQLRVDGARIMQHLQALSQFGRNPQGGVSRVAYSEADRQGREYVIGLMREAQLDVHIDTAGNIVGSRPGSDGSLKPILIGSHIDSVPEGGNYDGDVGSLSAIELAQILAQSKITLRHPLQVIIFQNEEGGTVGSHAIGLGLDERLLDSTSQSGKTIRDGIRLIGGDPNRLSETQRQSGSIAGYFELHIEQGGILEREKINIGVVEGIVGILHSDVTVDGFANHAGTTPMDQRHDALLSASKFIEKVNQLVTSVPGRQVGTVGWIKALPGAYNVIPGKVTLGLELRDLDGSKIDALFNQIRSEADSIGRAHGTKFSFTEPVVIHPALTDKSFQKMIDDTAKQIGLSTRTMPSGAGHDAQEIAKIGPVGMIFIPSIGGISHSPKEFSRPQDIENGANVLLHTLLKFDESNLANSAQPQHCSL